MKLRNPAPTIGAILTLLSLFVSLPLDRAVSQDKPTYRPTGEEASLVGVVSFAACHLSDEGWT